MGWFRDWVLRFVQGYGTSNIIHIETSGYYLLTSTVRRDDGDTVVTQQLIHLPDAGGMATYREDT
jgi:hypothetical protein